MGETRLTCEPDFVQRLLLQLGREGFRSEAAPLLFNGQRVSLHCYEEVSSTMDVAAELFESSASDHLIVLSKWQSAGRGRSGRKWLSAQEGNLAVTIASKCPNNISPLGCVYGLGVYRALSRFSSDLGIKWPNDILDRNSRKKICGLLCEVHQSVLKVGIGVNIGAVPTEVTTAISLRTIADQNLDYYTVAAAVICECLKIHFEFCANGFIALKPEYEKASMLQSSLVNITVSGLSTKAKVLGIGNNGSLIVDEGGNVRELFSEEVHIGVV